MKHDVGSGSSHSAHIPVICCRALKTSTRSWLHWRITILIPASVTWKASRSTNVFKCVHLYIQTQW